MVSCGGGGGGGGGGGASVPAASNSLTGCWWVYTETMSNGDVSKEELNFDNSKMTLVLYINAEKQLECYVTYTLSGNTISYSPDDFVISYIKSGSSMRTRSGVASFDYSVSGNSLTVSNGKLNGVSDNTILGGTTIVLTRKQ